MRALADCSSHPALRPPGLRWRELFLTLALVTGNHGSTATAAATQLANVRPTSDIEARSYPATDFVYVEHAGPYWTLGRSIDKVSAYIRLHGLTVSVVVRYAEPPNRRSTGMLRCRVGFFAKSMHTPTAPFRLVRLPAERAATFAIAGRMPDPNEDYKRLRRWIEETNDTAAGPITEVYPRTTNRRGASGATTEIRFTLTDKAEPAVPLADANVQATSTVLGTRDASVVPPVVTDNMSPSPTDRPATEKVHAEPVGPPTVTVAVEDAHDDPSTEPIPVRSVPAADTNAQPKPTTVTSAPATVDGGKPSHRSAGEGSRPSQPLATVRELFVSGRYEEVVDAILPDGPPSNPYTQRWLMAVTVRISAICRGIARLDGASPATQRSLREFLNTFDNRFRELAAEFSTEPLPGTQPVDLWARARQERLISELDLAMVRLGFRTVPVSAGMDSLMDLLHRLADLRPIMKNPPAARPTP